MTAGEAIARAELESLERAGLRRTLDPLDGPPGATLNMGGQTLIGLSSNDYLGLASNAQLSEAASRAGAGAGASRLICGSLPAHARLERAIASFEHSEAALLFNSGYCANVGALQALLGAEDAIFSDALNHASLIDGARLSRASVEVFPHCDLRALDDLLARTNARRKLICTDSVFSMDGDRAPLAGLCELAEKHGAMLLVDEAHATGVFGAGGSGLCEELGVAPRVDVRIGTLSKAAGSFGGFAVGSRAICELLMNRARSFVFTTALPPSVCEASLAAIELMRAPELREKLWTNVHHFARALVNAGVSAEPRSPIFPIVIGDAQRALEVSAQLRARGVLAKAIRPPTVPSGTSRLRLSVIASHTHEQLDHAARALGEVLKP